MIGRLKRAAKINRRNRRYRWPWGTGVWRIREGKPVGFLSEEFAAWIVEKTLLENDPLAYPTIVYET